MNVKNTQRKRNSAVIVHKRAKSIINLLVPLLRPSELNCWTELTQTRNFFAVVEKKRQQLRNTNTQQTDSNRIWTLCGYTYNVHILKRDVVR